MVSRPHHYMQGRVRSLFGGGALEHATKESIRVSFPRVKSDPCECSSLGELQPDPCLTRQTFFWSRSTSLGCCQRPCRILGRARSLRRSHTPALLVAPHCCRRD